MFGKRVPYLVKEPHMIKQYFAEVKLQENDSLSEVLEELVDEAENQYRTPYVEVTQVIQRNNDLYTVILNLDFPDTPIKA
jgi:methenyltetrahydromethanopterin cyclohydrolase